MKQRKKLSSTIRSKDQKRNPFTGNGFSERSNKNGESVHPSEHGTEPPLFPKCSKWIVFGITLVLRCTYVTRKENWWLLHPDEIFQSMEGKPIAYIPINFYFLNMHTENIKRKWNRLKCIRNNTFVKLVSFQELFVDWSVMVVFMKTSWHVKEYIDYQDLKLYF